MNGNDLQAVLQALRAELQPAHLVEFGINLGFCAVLVALLALVVWRRFAPGRQRLALVRNLVLVALTTMVIISTVRSSLALSLGLVGALSIVRFRTPVRDPEELALLFVAITVGVGTGASQRVITALGLAAILLVLLLAHRRQAGGPADVVVSIAAGAAAPADLLDRAGELLRQYAGRVRVLQIRQEADALRGDFLADIPQQRLAECRRRLHELASSLTISLVNGDE